MPQIVEVPGVGRVEFPDGMSDADIVKAIKGVAPQQSQAKPTDGVGTLDALLIGAGRSTDKVIQGVRQMYNKATGDQKTLDAISQDQAENDRLYAPLKAANPIAAGIGEALPALAVPVGGAGAGAASFIGRSALAGALPGALSYGDAADRIKAAGMGGAGAALGGAAGLGLGRLLSPAGPASISGDALQAAERIGLNLTAGQKTQNPAMQAFENYLAKSPGSSGAMQARAGANQTAMNKAAAGAMGQQGDALSEGAFAAAKKAIGAEFDRLGAVTNPQLGNDFMQALVQVDSANAARGAFKSKPVDTLVTKGLDLAASGKLTGTAYKEIRTAISNEAQSAFKAGDATYGQALKTVRNALDDAAKQSLSKADQEAWDTARKQWAAYKALTKSNVAEGGNVSAARLAGALRSGGDQFRTGAMNGPLADIARVGEAVKSVQNPNSGQLVNQMLYGNPITGLPMMAANKAAQMAYMSRPAQAYLGSSLLGLGSDGLAIGGKLSQPVGLPALQGLLGAQ